MSGNALSFSVDILQHLIVPTFILDRDCKVLVWNHACERLTGIAAEEVLGTSNHWKAFYSKPRLCLADIIVQQKTDELAELYSNFSLSTEVPNGIKAENWCVMPRLGTRLYLAIDSSPIYDEAGKLLAVVETLRDKTGSKMADIALNESHQQMFTLLNSMAEGAYCVDVKGDCVFVNRSFLQILGYEHPDEIIGKHIHELIHHSHSDGSHYPATECKMYNAYRLNQDIHVFDEVFWHKNGSAIPVEYWSQPIIVDNVMQGAIATFIDITERKKAEANLKKTISLLNATLESTTDAILVVDLNNNWILYNKQFVDLWKFSAEIIALKDDAAALLFVQSQLIDADLFIDKVRELYATPEVHSFDTLKFKDGKIIERFSVPQYIEGKVVGRVWSFRDVTTRKEMEAQVFQLAFYDPLTKLPNRRLLIDRLHQTMASSKRTGHCSALMFLDLDNFKPLNDTHGHVVGDLLLIEAANRLKSTIREADTVARFGGDEFVVILNELEVDKSKATAQARMIAEKIRTRLSETYFLSNRQEGSIDSVVEHHCTTSVGVVIFTNAEDAMDDVMKWADSAMYQAKQAGRNKIQFYAAN
jgi:diguanylate cyclase (GGDEF)-like protein/PAS domain S-box-containing protein